MINKVKVIWKKRPYLILINICHFKFCTKNPFIGIFDCRLSQKDAQMKATMKTWQCSCTTAPMARWCRSPDSGAACPMTRRWRCRSGNPWSSTSSECAKWWKWFSTGLASTQPSTRWRKARTANCGKQISTARKMSICGTRGRTTLSTSAPTRWTPEASTEGNEQRAKIDNILMRGCWLYLWIYRIIYNIFFV